MFFKVLEDAVCFEEFKLDTTYKPTTNKPDDKKITAQIEREKVKLKRAREAYESEVYTLDEFKESKLSIERKIKELENKLTEVAEPDPQEEIKKLKSRIVEVVPALKSAALTETEKNSIVKSFLSKAVYYKPSGDLDLFFYY